MYIFEKILTPERLDICKRDRLLLREDYFSKAEEEIGVAAVLELRDLYNLYDEKLYIWYASLWEPEIGGFYFSESARDCDGFLPDIESTVQTMNFTYISGLSCGKSYIKAAPESMRRALSKFVKSLEDPIDGYFYHPQWGKNIVTSRRGRDLAWALGLLSALGEKPNYPTAADRLATSEKIENKLLPEHFCSLSAWKEYLNEILSLTDPKKKSYWVGNILQSQTPQIKAAGAEYADLLFNMLDARQLPKNGLWEPQVNYASVNGMMKFLLLYSAFDRYVNYVDVAMQSAISVALSYEPIIFCSQYYNPLVTINSLLTNMLSSGRKKDALRLRKLILFRAPELIRVSKDKISLCKRDDGGFSYHPSEPFSRFAQKAPVSLGYKGSEVDATGISSTGCLRNLCSLLGLPMIPIFGKEDSKLFYELIENGYVHEKIYEKPDWFDDAIDPEKLTETY